VPLVVRVLVLTRFAPALDDWSFASIARTMAILEVAA